MSGAGQLFSKQFSAFKEHNDELPRAAEINRFAGVASDAAAKQ